MNLNPHIFNDDVEQLPIRKGFGEGLLAAGEADPRIVGLCADLTESTQMHLFKKKFPERFVEIGVAEQNLASVASGMAAMGKIPFIALMQCSVLEGIGNRSVLRSAITTGKSS